ncbi:MAG TPA: M28 family metallopeptidase [Caldilineaceae bacterium]|nr:M28 family metallopeptidase [Caldilineaceae bacterium]
MAAADYIEEIFRTTKLTLQRQSYPCPAWSADECQLQIGGSTFDAIPNTYSPSCTVAAPLAVVRTLAELAAVDATNRILLLCGELTTDPIMSLVDHAIYLPERDCTIGQLLRQKAPKAIIAVNLSHRYNPILLEDIRLNIPSVTVSAEVGRCILQHSHLPITLKISSVMKPGETANLIGLTRSIGTHRIILCAHYDTKNGTPGAWDNASGVAALLALAEQYAVESPPVTIEFIAFSAEEYGIEDSYEDPYLGQFGLAIPPFVYGQEIAALYKPSKLDDVLAVINLDGIGLALSPNTVATMACSAELKALVDKVKLDYPAILGVNGWPASNHYGFYANGIPSIPISSLEMKNIMHTAADTLDWVSGEQIGEVVSFVQRLVLALADKSPLWCRQPRK